MNENTKKYKLNYAKEKYKRVPLDIPVNLYEEWKAYAESIGVPLNAFIKQSVAQRMGKEE